MTIYVGGLRQRLIRDSLHAVVREAMDDLGWFDSGRAHKPVTLQYESEDPQNEIMPNAVCICDDDVTSVEEEMGSDFSEHIWDFYCDIYAESSSLGIHLSNDIKAILEGRMPSIGRSGPKFSVYDWGQATPTELFQCQIENVLLLRGRNFSKRWERYWYSLSFSVLDYYGNEADS